MGSRTTQLNTGTTVAIALSALIFVSASPSGASLDAVKRWTWVLTGLQVLALWAAGRHNGWGWLMGGLIQLPWIAYAMTTHQFGFIPGCIVSGTVQIYHFLHVSPTIRPMEVRA